MTEKDNIAMHKKCATSAAMPHPGLKNRQSVAFWRLVAGGLFA